MIAYSPGYFVFKFNIINRVQMPAAWRVVYSRHQKLNCDFASSWCTSFAESVAKNSLYWRLTIEHFHNRCHIKLCICLSMSYPISISYLFDAWNLTWVQQVIILNGMKLTTLNGLHRGSLNFTPDLHIMVCYEIEIRQPSCRQEGAMY